MWEWIEIALDATMIVVLIFAVRLLKRLERSLEEEERDGENVERSKTPLE